MTEQTGAVTERADTKSRIAFVDIGRGIAALLVYYSHLTVPRAHLAVQPPGYIGFVRSLTSEPVLMTRQGIGEIGVAFFFLVSGYVVTPIALRYRSPRFAINRLLRIYPPLAFAILLTALVLVVGIPLPRSVGSPQVTPLTVLTNISTANFLIYPQVVLLPVTWTLIVELLFYVLLVLLMPLLRRSVWVTIAVELGVVLAVLLVRSNVDLGPSYSLLGVNVSYLPILILGQIVWAWRSGRIPGAYGGLCVALAWVEYVLGDVLGVGRVDDAYNLALALGFGLFLVGLFAESMLRQRRFWTGLSERTYSLYLIHVPVSYALLALLLPQLPFTLVVLIAIVATFAVVEICYRFVERPCHRLARRLARGRRRGAHAAVVTQAASAETVPPVSR